MHPKNEEKSASTLLGGAIISLGLASFAAAQEESPLPPEPSVAQSMTEPIREVTTGKEDQLPALPKYSSNLDTVDLEKTEFAQFTTEGFEKRVLHTTLPLEGGQREYVFLFTPRDGKEPRIVNCWYPSEDVHKRITAYLEGRDFQVDHETLGNILKQFSPTKEEAQEGQTTKNIIRVGKLVLSSIVLLVAVGSYLTGALRRRYAKQSDAQMAAESLSASGDPIACRYEIVAGAQPQLCVTLAPGEVFFAQKGSLLRRVSEISATLASGVALGFSGAVGSMTKSLLSGESLYYQRFKNPTERDLDLVLGPSQLGQFLPLNLSEYPRGISASSGAFFAASPGVKMDVDGKAGWKGLFSGTGMFQQRFSGAGQLFLFALGTLECVSLKEGDKIVADSDTIFAWESGVSVDLKRQSFADAALSGEGLVVAHISGAGKAWFATRGTSDEAAKGGIISNLLRGFIN